MSRKTYEISFNIAGRLASTFRGAFSSASSQLQGLGEDAKRLKGSLRNLEKEYKDGSMSVDEYRAAHQRLTRQLEKTYEIQKRLQQLQRQRGEIQQRSDQIRGQMIDTAGMAAPFVAVTAAAYNYEEAQRRIQIQANMTAQESQKAFNVVREAYKSGLGEDIQSTSYAYGLMSQIIKSETSKQQQLILQGALAIEKYWQEGPEAISRAVHNMTTNFKNLSKTQAMDIVIAGFRNGLNYAGDYLDTLYEYSPQFEDLGYSAEQFYSILTAGKNAGAFNLDKVADAVKEFNIRAQDGSKTTAEGFAMIGLDANKMAKAVAAGGEEGINALNMTIQALNKIKDPVKRNQAGVALFGTQWEDLTEKVILGLNVTSKAAKEIDGATKKVVETATKAKDGTVTWTQLGRKIQDTAAALGTALKPALTPTIMGLNKGATAIANFAQEHPAAAKAIGTSATTLIGLRLAWLGTKFTWNQAKMMGTELKTAINNLRTSQLRARTATLLGTGATKAMTLAQKGLNLALRLNPYTRIALLIGGLVTAGIALYKNWDKIKQKAPVLWATITDSFKEGVNKAIGLLNGLIEKINLIPGINIGTIDKLHTTKMSVSPMAMKGVTPHATGGIFNSPHIGMVAEAGPEAIIPLDGSPRSMSLWEKTGELIGAGRGGITINVNFAPVINGAGPEIIPAIQEQQRSFIDQLKDVIHQERRLAYG
ncbi:MAG: phage tail tape measure protein [Desulfotomaculum sp.]|nr:phage tail tape measure protein [Desulfotomaculum sp.]